MPIALELDIPFVINEPSTVKDFDFYYDLLPHRGQVQTFFGMLVIKPTWEVFKVKWLMCLLLSFNYAKHWQIYWS